MRIDPDTSLGLLLRVAGLGSFFLFGASITGSLLVAGTALALRRISPARRAGATALALVGLYVSLLLAGPLLLGSRSLAPGQELAFCGFDCHLHLTATRVSRNGGVDVAVRARSDARQAPEDPRYVDLTLVDERGARYRPDSMTLDTPLGPGDVYERTLHFAVPADAKVLHLVGTWTGWPAYVVPGPDNIFVQRRSGIVLPAGSSPAAADSGR